MNGVALAIFVGLILNACVLDHGLNNIARSILGRKKV